MLNIRKYWHKIIQSTWNIAITEIGQDLSPINIRWITHEYHDRWFADPFFLEETNDTYVILAEEFMLCNNKGRICKLVIEKQSCKLIKNETLLDLDTHLSFPNVFRLDGSIYIYPENSAAGQLTIYRLTEHGLERNVTIPIPLIDPVLFKANDGKIILLGTLPEEANGNSNTLHVYKSNQYSGPFVEIQQITFSDNIARRAGNVFITNGKYIAPAQICNKHYGEGISLHEISFDNDGFLVFKEIKRLNAKRITKMTGFHTYNVLGNKIVIDGYHYGNEFIHDLYSDIRGLKYM